MKNTEIQALKKQISSLKKRHTKLTEYLTAEPYSELMKLYEAFNQFKQELLEKHETKTKTLADDVKLKNFIKREKELREIIELQKGSKLRDELLDVQKKLNTAHSKLYFLEEKHIKP